MDRTDYRDRGIDIICTRKDGKYDLVQCKGYLSQNSISGRDLSSFFAAVLELQQLKVPIGNLIIVNLSASGKLKNWRDSNFKRLQEAGLNINQNITPEQFNIID